MVQLAVNHGMVIFKNLYSIVFVPSEGMLLVFYSTLQDLVLFVQLNDNAHHILGIFHIHIS